MFYYWPTTMKVQRCHCLGLRVTKSLNAPSSPNSKLTVPKRLSTSYGLGDIQSHHGRLHHLPLQSTEASSGRNEAATARADTTAILVFTSQFTHHPSCPPTFQSHQASAVLNHGRRQRLKIRGLQKTSQNYITEHLSVKHSVRPTLRNMHFSYKLTLYTVLPDPDSAVCQYMTAGIKLWAISTGIKGQASSQKGARNCRHAPRQIHLKIF